MHLKINNNVYDTSKKPLLMGILNLSIDSPVTNSVISVDKAVQRARVLINDGADIIDVGADSTSSLAENISIEKEVEIIKQVVEGISKLGVIVSIDTWKHEVAESAIMAGASIVNDVTGFRDAKMIEIVKKNQVIALAMHMRGMPKKHYEVNQKYEYIDVEIFNYLKNKINYLKDCDIDEVWIDPGFGFGKSTQDNISLLYSLNKLRQLKKPILISASRKGFLGDMLGIGISQKSNELLDATLIFNLFSFLLGADILRVHDVKNMNNAMKTLCALVHFMDNNDESKNYYSMLINLLNR